MLNDVAMVKGLIQSWTCHGAWKDHLRRYPLGFRRPNVASRVAEGLLNAKTVGRGSADLRLLYLGCQVRDPTR